jgi:hypothetical protein
MTLRLPQIAVALLAAIGLAVAGCGDSDEPKGEKLPPAVTQELLPQLESVGDRVAAGVSGACDDIYASADDGGNIEPIDAALSSIPSGVDPEIRTALEQSVERLKQLVDEECAEIGAAEQDEPDTVTEEETTPTETETVETETVPTETETTETETETAPTTPEQPPDVESPGRGPDGTGPPGLGGGAEAPDGGDE